MCSIEIGKGKISNIFFICFILCYLRLRTKKKILDRSILQILTSPLLLEVARAARIKIIILSIFMSTVIENLRILCIIGPVLKHDKMEGNIEAI